MKIKILLWFSILLFVSVQAKASLIGINIITENHRVWGGTTIKLGGSPPTFLTLDYDMTSSDPIAFSTSDLTISGGELFDVTSEAGNFRVMTDAVQTNFAGPAFAESTYQFMSEQSQLSIHAYGGGVVGPIRIHSPNRLFLFSI